MVQQFPSMLVVPERSLRCETDLLEGKEFVDEVYAFNIKSKDSIINNKTKRLVINKESLQQLFAKKESSKNAVKNACKTKWAYPNLLPNAKPEVEEDAEEEEDDAADDDDDEAPPGTGSSDARRLISLL